MLVILPEIDSTHLEIKRRQQPNLFLQALKQTGGIGQQGTHWYATDTMVALSWASTPQLESTTLLQKVTQGILDYLDSINIQPQLKWPNDILIGGKKVAGILIERGQLDYCSIGINVAHYKQGPTTFTWTTLQQHTSKPINPLAIGNYLYAKMGEVFHPRKLHDWYRDYHFIGKKISFSYPQRYEGTVHTITHDGHLIVQTEEGHFFRLVTSKQHAIKLLS